MARRMRDLLAERATESFVGRSGELSVLLQALEPAGPPVTFVHGIGGIGKSSLLEAFTARAQARGVVVVRLDCRAVEPTESGFLRGLGAAIGLDAATPGEAAERLGRLGPRVVLSFDTYELYRLMDTWLRQIFVPSLSENVRVIFSGREAPVSSWLAEWQGLLRSVPLGPLNEWEAAELLSGIGVNERDAPRLNQLARGHPLALKLAAAAIAERHDVAIEEAAVQRVLEELTRMYLADIRDPLTREALDAASVVRRTTLSLLGAILPNAAPQDAYDRLRSLPFVESGGDGLIVHDVVQQAIAGALKASDPVKYRSHRLAAFRQLQSEVRSISRADAWRYTADLVFIIENEVWREAFFPSTAHQFAVEPARPNDGEAIRAINMKHEGPHAARLLDYWWGRSPESFSVVRDRDGSVIGFFCFLDQTKITQSDLQADLIVRGWTDHLRRYPMPKNYRAVFSRRWLSLENGELPSAVQAAAWLESKRTAMALRPYMRRVYLTVCDLQTYAPAAVALGFQPIPEATMELDGRTFHSAFVDFGPGSVDGWLAILIGRELGVTEDDLLDLDSHELVLNGARVGLTKLEFGVMHYLHQNEGKPVTRQSLLSDVWGYDYEGGSNVVDVVIRSLRKKLGSKSRSLETVSGVGYRFRRG